jgi:outer membrane protein assembly factor BamB
MLKNKNISSLQYIRSDPALNPKKPVLLSAVVILIILVAALPSARAAGPVWTYSSAGNALSSVSVSSDGSAIAVGADKIWLFSRSGVLLAKEPYGELVKMTPDGMHLLSAYSSTLYFFERNVAPDKTNFSYQKKWEYNLPASVRSIDISDDGNTIVASSQSSGTYILSSPGDITDSNETYSALVRVASNGQIILGVSATGLFQYSKTGRVSSQYEDISIGSEPDVMEITSTGTMIVFNDAQRVVAVNAQNGTQRWKTRATGEVTSLALTPDGSGILVGSENGDIDLFDSKGNLSWSYSANPENKPGAMVKSVALSDDGKIAVAGTYDGMIVALDSAGREIWTNQTKDRISHVAMSSDGSLVVATGEETVYAFSPSAASSPVPRTTFPASGTPHPPAVKNVSGQVSTQKPEISVTPPRTVTSVPTTYSVIRTPTQSPVSEFISLSALLIALLVLKRR